MARYKLRSSKKQTYSLSEFEINCLEHLSRLAEINKSQYLGNLITQAYNSVYNWNDAESIRKDINDCRSQIEKIQKREKELSGKLELVDKISKTQQEWKEKLDANYKEDKDMFVVTLSERMVMKETERQIMQGASEFSNILGNKWTKEELVTEALIKFKTYTDMDMVAIRVKHNQPSDAELIWK